MNIRCEKCGELIWYTEESPDGLYCRHCGKHVEKPVKQDDKDKKKG